MLFFVPLHLSAFIFGPSKASSIRRFDHMTQKRSFERWFAIIIDFMPFGFVWIVLL